MNEQYDEVPKRRKKKDSDTSHAKKKAKHKHDYQSCFIRYFDSHHNERVSPSSICKTCGKFGYPLEKGISSERLDDGRYRALTNEEMIKKRPNWPIFEVKGDEEAYVPIDG